MKRVKLKVMGVSYSQTQSGAYALLLIEENGERRIPIIIGGFEAQSIVIKLENLEPPRPLTHDLFRMVSDEFGIYISEVMIYKLEEGVFYSRLICSNGTKEVAVDSRTSDAVALALRFSCPIYISEDILEKAQLTNSSSENDFTVSGEEDAADEVTEGYASLSDEELFRIIDDAVKTEDYEKAASVRDELEKRKKKKKK
jgi:uncharacterized protein